MGGVARSATADLLARLALSAAFEPGDEVVAMAVAQYGAEHVVGLLNPCGESAPELRGHLARWRGGDWCLAAQQEGERAQELGIRFLSPLDGEWPDRLDDLDHRAPLVLRLRGPLELAAATRCSLAVVGARAATRYGVWVAEEIAAQVGARGVCVVSGGAFGIDAAAHRGALAAAGETVLVSAAGVDRSVPLANDGLFEQVARVGLIVSEVPIGTRPSRHRFLVRNRLIAALTPVTLVVEAASRSGALATARDADSIGRTVASVPGPITSSMSAGSNSLLKQPDTAVVVGGDDAVELVAAAADVG